jgi:hypothetical protein
MPQFKTHCINGHPFAMDNVARVSSRPYRRICLVCKRERDRRSRAERKAMTPEQRAAERIAAHEQRQAKLRKLAVRQPSSDPDVQRYRQERRKASRRGAWVLPQRVVDPKTHEIFLR